MGKRFRLFSIVFWLLGSAAVVNANLIVNGSFEAPVAGGFGLFPSIPGWTTPLGGFPIELGAGTTYGVTGFDQKQVMEMDSTGNAIVDQTVVATAGSYKLSFLYGDRSGVPPR